MNASREISPTSILVGVRDALVAEIMATLAPEPIPLRRDIAVIIAAALGEVIDSIGSIEQRVARSAQILAELEEARAEIARLSRGREWVPAGTVIDLTELLRRPGGRRREAPSDGGAA